MTDATATNLAWAAKDARQSLERRDKLIRQMRTEGATLRAIAATSGMSVAGVQRVIDRGPAHP